ncbi:MAG: xanthine dehydrogenase family protein molybdopterin-binding subunit, partial [Acidimicrobiales bacterium]
MSAADLRSVPRVDGWQKVTGTATYAIDVELPNTAYGAIVRSERAHARIIAIDVEAAAAAAGVVGAICGSDLKGIEARFGHIVPDHPVLAVDKVRYYGEPVAIVVAETPAAAFDAAAMVAVEYDELPSLMTASEAIAASVRIHEDVYSHDEAGGFLGLRPESAGNVFHTDGIEWGDVDAALEAADVVVETATSFPMVFGYAMELYNASASYRPGDLRVVTTAQHPFQVRAELARMFALPLSAVRVEVPYVGGGYGTKSYTKLEPLAAAASWFTGRPVKVAVDVDGAMHTTRADAAAVRVRTGFDGDGGLVARDFEITLDSGAYADNSPLVLTKVVHRCFGPYRIPNLRVNGRAVYTTTTPASSYRGFGAPQGALAGELNLDEAAEHLGLDPVELRRRNLLRPGEAVIPGKRPLDADLAADLEAVAATLAAEAKPPEAGRRRAWAVAVSASDAGASPVSTAIVRVHADGSATVNSGSTEIGQGSATALAQIAARELGLELGQVAIAQSDTRFVPFEWSTGASRTTTLAGLAVQRACEDAWHQLESMAAELAGAGVEEVCRDGGPLALPDGRTMTPGEVIRRWFGAAAGEVIGRGVVRNEGATAQLPPFWEVGVVGVEVAVDEATGAVSVEHLVTVGDVGHAINPGLVEGQDLGAATQGLGAALYEEMVYDGQQLVNPNLVEYRVPRFRDLPCRITSVLAERGDGVGPYGAKGGGEGSLNPIPAAVAAAVGRAVGAWPDTLPLTP